MRIFTLILSLLMFLQVFTVESKEDWKRVYLATYPRSGNHWTRNLFEEVTHVTTSSVYADKDPQHLKTPFPWGGYAPIDGCVGNCRYPQQGEIVIIKTHFPAHVKTEFDLQPATKVIRIVRHPLDTFYSHFFHNNKPSHQLTAEGKIPSWFVNRSVERWKKFQKYWDQQPNVLTVRYEDLMTNPHFYLQEIVKASGYQVKEEDINRALSKFPPQGGILKHLNDYDSKDLALISKELGSLMKKYGYSLKK